MIAFKAATILFVRKLLAEMPPETRLQKDRDADDVHHKEAALNAVIQVHENLIQDVGIILDELLNNDVFYDMALEVKTSGMKEFAQQVGESIVKKLGKKHPVTKMHGVKDELFNRLAEKYHDITIAFLNHYTHATRNAGLDYDLSVSRAQKRILQDPLIKTFG